MAGHSHHALPNGASPVAPARSVHFAENDPGLHWTKDRHVALDGKAENGAVNVLTPNVIRLPGGAYRMYYTALWWGPNHYEDSRAVIRSAVSEDAERWTVEAGNRLEPHAPHAGLRVLCPDVIPRPAGGYRMYFEAKADEGPTVILSAVSDDGLSWQPEPGRRIGNGVETFGSPRCLYVASSTPASTPSSCRMYFHHRPYPQRPGPGAGHEIRSARSEDGLQFRAESGARLVQEHDYESCTVYAPEVIRLASGGYRMYYAAWSEPPQRGRIYAAHSQDGLAWTKAPEPCVTFGGQWDQLKVSEPCVIALSDGRFRMFYEGCDASGRWRILSATSCRG